MFKNLGELIERILHVNVVATFQVPVIEIASSSADETSNSTPEAKPVIEPDKTQTDSSSPLSPKTAAQQRREERYLSIKQLQKEGVPIREIARRMNMSRNAVRTYCRAETCPRTSRKAPINTKLDRYLNELRDLFNSGCRNKTHLWRELRNRGFRGAKSTFTRWLRNHANDMPPAASTNAPKFNTYFMKQVAFMMLQQKEKLNPEEAHAIDYIINSNLLLATAYSFGQRFVEILHDKKHELLDTWISDAIDCKIEMIKNFAASIRADLAAVRNALILQWSNGQLEEQVNWLKTIKRQMYGRASFLFLKKRILGLSV